MPHYTLNVNGQQREVEAPADMALLARAIEFPIVVRPPEANREWITRLLERRHYNVAVVALANKIARTAWAVLAKGAAFDQVKWHPLEQAST